MKYKGIELKEFTSDSPVVFDPPRKMLVWDRADSEPCERTVLAYFPTRTYRKVIARSGEYMFFAEIPEEPKPRRATDRELAKWLAQGNGQFTNVNAAYAWTELDVLKENEDRPCDTEWRIRKWDDKEWHEPTADYMGLEG